MPFIAGILNISHRRPVDESKLSAGLTASADQPKGLILSRERTAQPIYYFDCPYVIEFSPAALVEMTLSKAVLVPLSPFAFIYFISARLVRRPFPATFFFPFLTLPYRALFLLSVSPLCITQLVM